MSTDENHVEIGNPLGAETAVDGKASAASGKKKLTASIGAIGAVYKSPTVDNERAAPQSFEEHQEALRAKMSQLFDQIDRDGDGNLSRTEVIEKIRADDEFEDMMHLAGKSTMDIYRHLERSNFSQATDSVLSGFDTNADDNISRDEFLKLLATQDFQYSIEWLEEQIVFHAVELRRRKLTLTLEGIDLGVPVPAWCLLFEVLPDEDGMPSNMITHETVEVVHRLWELDLSVDIRRSVDLGEVLILVGIPYATMRDEAEQMHMMMRLAKTRGQHPYHTDFHEHYTQYDRHKPDKEGMLLNEDGTFCGDLYQTTFISAHEQQAIINRIKRSGMDLKYRMQLGKRDTILKSTRKAVEKKSPIRAFELKSMLTACGAFRTKCGEVMGDEVEMIAKQVLADPFFTMYPAKYVESQGKAALIAAQQQRACDDHMREAGLPVLTYDSIETVLKSLERYTSKGVNAKGKQLAVPPGPGANEIYVGSLQMIFPVHNDEELKSLRDNWGNAGWMFKLQVGVWRNEGADSLALGHPSRELYSERFGFLYQPIDEIRDYFGDDNAIYFSWLGTYTKALIPASALGLLTMFNQPLAGGVDENQLTVYYSFFLSLWSVLFLSVWKRQEAVHAFLWGSEGFEATEEPRPDFKGILIVNKETGAEDFQHGSFLPRATRKMVSSCIIAFCMVVTVFGALTASSLKNRLPKECNLNIWVEKTSYDGLPCGAVNDEDLGAVDCCFCTDVLQCPNYNEVDANGTVTLDRVKHDMEKWGELTPTEKFGWQLLSSFLNLGIIITAGLVYEAIADWLNDLENFRTETEYSDGLILKNFLFQFVNNYFLLFYIAYLRQIEFESLGIAAKRCDQSCLSELQMQMFVVFSGKTIALQGVELAKPIIQAKFKVVMELMQVRKVMKMASNASEALAQSVMTDTQLRELGLDEESIEEQKQREVHKEALSKRGSKDKSKMTDPYELQSHMVNYEDDRGTFDDFNEMAIQYGYIALFSPCFPLAPLLAFLNNVTEIRVDAWKLCKGYQRCTASPKEDIGSWFAVLNIIGFIAVLTNATMIVFVGSQLAQTPTEELGIEERLNSRHLWVKGIAIEHSVMLMRVFVVIFMPTYPGWIADAKDVLRFHINEMERAVKNREALWGDESELNKEFTELLMDSEGVLRASEFFSADENRDTKLNRKEFESKFGDIGIKFEDMDVNHDGTITIKEFTAFVNARRAEEGRVRERQRKLQAQKAKRTAE